MTVSAPPLKISNSEIQTFRDCPRKWWLTYYRELARRRDEDTPTGVKNLGLRVHLALKGMYEQATDPIDGIDFIYAEEIRELIKFGRDDLITELQQEQDLARAMLEGYVDWLAEKAIDADLEYLGSEQVIEVPSGVETPAGGRVWMRGVLDQRWRRQVDGALRFRDFKTVQTVEDQRGLLYLNPQMRFYLMLSQLHQAYLSQTEGKPFEHVTGALYTMLKRVKRTKTAKPPFYAQEDIDYNRKIIEATWAHVHSALIKIVEVRDHLDRGANHHYIVPPRQTRDCTWKCPFYMICGMFDDGSDVEGAIRDHYEHQDPHERYRRDEQEERS
jgi:rRNA maturation protein Nop10